jgi:AraC-like DNA-binding protein
VSAINTAVARLPVFVLRQAEAAGLDRRELLQAADLSEEALADPDARILVRKNLELWRFILESISDADLGIRFGSELRIRDAGLVGYTMLHSATLLEAMQRLFRFGRILEEGDPPQLKLSSNGAEYGWRAHPEQEVLLQRMIDYELAALVGVAREITGVDLDPLEIRYPHTERPSDLKAHRRYFRCTLSFDQPFVGVVFRRRDLDLPVREADEELGSYLERYAEEVLESLAPGGTVADRVERVMWTEMKEGRLTLQGIASALAVSPRTLQRRLREEGTSFAELRDRFRRDMAVVILRDRRLAIYEVAYLLGYSEPSTFYRAFRRWMGTSPHEFRASTAS